ncbi:MAG: methylmalonyl-CoA mutase family protein [Polyangiales bacterium]
MNDHPKRPGSSSSPNLSSSARYAEARARWHDKNAKRAKKGGAQGDAPKRLPLWAQHFDPQDVYGPDDLESAGVDSVNDLGLPGEPPFTRGVQPTMFRGRPWTMRQYAGFGTAQESNERYRYLLSQGQTGLSVAFDLPTQMGRDSDHAFAKGEVGRVGVAIDTLDDMRTLFAGIPLDKVSTSMTINATAAILLSLYVALAEEQGIPGSALRGTIQNDILKEYIARGTYIYPPRPSLRIIADIFGYCATQVPKWNTISISGYHVREAGCDAIQEVAFTVADGIAYVETAIQAGLDVDAFAAQLSFFFNGHNNFLEEVAKFRAARRVWERVMRERFHAKSERSRALKFHCQTAGMTLQAQQPLNNVVRVAVQALAAVLGGCQSLHTNSFDEALGLPTAAAATLALRTQQIIANESGVTDIIDPLGGSYAIEALTHRIEQGALAYIEKIDAMGGMVHAIEQGFVQREIQNTAYEYQLQIERKERVIVGLNEFVTDSEAIPAGVVNPKLEAEQCARVALVRSSRDQVAFARSLEALHKAAQTKDNLMPLILSAVKANATVGEISDVMRAVFGEHQETLTI